MQIIATISQARSLCERFATGFQTLSAHKELCEHVERLLPILLDLLETTSGRFKQHEVISLPEAIQTELNNVQLIARKHVELATKASQSLSLTEYETRIVSLLERLSELRLTFYNYDKDHSNARTPAETKIRELSGRKSRQKRAIRRRAGNVRFAETGWWCAQSYANLSPCYLLKTG
jgi:hypothetical protein